MEFIFDTLQIICNTFIWIPSSMIETYLCKEGRDAFFTAIISAIAATTTINTNLIGMIRYTGCNFRCYEFFLGFVGVIVILQEFAKLTLIVKLSIIFVAILAASRTFLS